MVLKAIGCIWFRLYRCGITKQTNKEREIWGERQRGLWRTLLPHWKNQTVTHSQLCQVGQVVTCEEIRLSSQGSLHVLSDVIHTDVQPHPAPCLTPILCVLNAGDSMLPLYLHVCTCLPDRGFALLGLKITVLSWVIISCQNHTKNHYS